MRRTDHTGLAERPDTAHKGRGAISNRSGRFETEQRVRTFDDWRNEEPGPRPQTTVTPDSSRTVIARNKSPDIGFDRSINPYRGCEHGCVYCFARPTHAWLGLSPGLDFETRLFAKPDAAALLRGELAAPRYTVAPIALGTNTDPYQPVERTMRITRSILETLAECNHPVTIVTKSDLVLRDLDILEKMAERSLCSVAISVTTLDRDLCRRMEPRAPAPHRRLEAVSRLADAGIPVHVLVAPVIPSINDHEIEIILKRAAEAGAHGAGYVLIRLTGEVADLFDEWLRQHYPDRADRVLSAIRQTRRGALYRSNWGERQTGTGALAELIARRFTLARRRFGLARETRGRDLDTTLFRRPGRDGEQLCLRLED